MDLLIFLTDYAMVINYNINQYALFVQSIDTNKNCCILSNVMVIFIAMYSKNIRLCFSWFHTHDNGG